MIEEITFTARAQGDPLPIESADFGIDLTDHTIHLVIAGVAELAGVATVTRAAGTNGADDLGASSVVFPDDSLLIASTSAGTYRASYIVDKDSPTLRETVGAGWFPIRDEPG